MMTWRCGSYGGCEGGDGDDDGAAVEGGGGAAAGNDDDGSVATRWGDEGDGGVKMVVVRGVERRLWWRRKWGSQRWPENGWRGGELGGDGVNILGGTENTKAHRAALWHAISDTQRENQELQLQIAEERCARLDLAEVINSKRRG
ncbi:hypothetical protein Tco_0655637 [Tanacetum coccineum]|uniref:Uncharacterized protein n=1 Tax=Tanacetum coccineum TaxID=301880 RepID=A0ABQ4X6J2_9ASTR